MKIADDELSTLAASAAATFEATRGDGPGVHVVLAFRDEKKMEPLPTLVKDATIRDVHEYTDVVRGILDHIDADLRPDAVAVVFDSSTDVLDVARERGESIEEGMRLLGASGPAETVLVTAVVLVNADGVPESFIRPRHRGAPLMRFPLGEAVELASLAVAPLFF